MGINIGWKPEDTTVGAMYSHGKDYLYGLLIDYERYVHDFGYIPISQFIEGWTCIPPSIFDKLRKTDRVFDYNGDALIICENPYTYGEDNVTYVTVTPVNEDGTIDASNTYSLNSGELYSYNVIHMDYFYKTIKAKGEPLCPILITKTSQPQS